VCTVLDAGEFCVHRQGQDKIHNILYYIYIYYNFVSYTIYGEGEGEGGKNKQNNKDAENTPAAIATADSGAI